MPNHPIPLALFRAANRPVAAPSANRFARPSATTAQHVLEDLDGRIDLILDGGPARIGLESTILDVTKSPPAILRPGGIPLETLQGIIPDVHIVSRHLRPDEAGIEAPGMLSKHYSPRAELRLFKGVLDRVISAMQREAQDCLNASKHVGILCPDAERGHFENFPVQLFALGSTLDEISHNLFDGMRQLDHAGVNIILVHGFEADGLGAALWDRLLRAAEGQVIEC
jgi:L-threonylcarbamoyladenylate synthase